MGTSSTSLALLQWGITATAHQTTPVSFLPSHQPLQSSGISQRAETWIRTQHSRSHWDQVTAGPPTHPKTEMVPYPLQEKLYPPLGHRATAVYPICTEKQLFCNSSFIFYCTQEGEKKSSFQKWLFKIDIQEKISLERLKSSTSITQ